MAQARVWNATYWPISVSFKNYNRDIFSQKYVYVNTTKVVIAPGVFHAYDNLTSYLEFTVDSYDSEMIDAGDSWQYVVYPQVRNCQFSTAVTQRYNLLDTIPAELMQLYGTGKYLSDWMQRSRAVLSSRTLWDLVLPGSHDAGSFSALNSGYVQTQTYDIGDQLKRGVRYFDIRVKQRSDDAYVMCHDTFPPGDAQLLDAALDQISQFVIGHSQEMLVLRMSASLSDSMAYTTFQDHYIAKLQDHLVVLDVPTSSQRADPADYTVDACLSKGTSIVLISPHGEEPSVAPKSRPGRNRTYQWKTSYLEPGAHVLRDSWDNAQTFAGVACDKTPEEKVEFVRAQVPNWLEGNQDYPGNRTAAECKDDHPKTEWVFVGDYFNAAAVTIWTPNIIGDTINLLQPEIPAWAHQWMRRADVMAKMNIVYLDAVWSAAGVFPVRPDVIPSVIELNRHK